MFQVTILRLIIIKNSKRLHSQSPPAHFLMYGLQNSQYYSIKINSQAYTPQASSPMGSSMASEWTSRTPPMTPATDIADSQFTEFLNIWKTQISIPVLAYEKVLKIIDQYILLKPNLQKKQQELQTLLEYNTKLIQAMESFQAHQKKILDISNYLVKLYAKTFKKHFENKHKQFDQSIFKQLHSIFDTFSMKEWQVDPKTIELPKINLKYKQYLFKIMVDHYIFPNQQLQKLIQKKTISAQNKTSEQRLWQKLQQKIKEYNKIAQKITIDNMFDVYEKKRKIVKEVKFFQIESEAIEADNMDRLSRIKNFKKPNSRQLQSYQQHKSYNELDEQFMQTVKRLHSDLQQTNPVKIKKYVLEQIEYRTKLKRRQLKEKKKFESYHSSLKEENTDLKEEIEQIKEKITELERINSEQKAQIDYLSIKTSVSKKGNSQNNMTLIQPETSIISGEKLGKKDSARKSNLEAQVKRLDQLVKLKQKQLGSFSFVNTGLSELKTNTHQLYQSLTAIKQVMQGLNSPEEGFMQEKPTINTSNCLNLYTPSSTNSILSNSQTQISKKLDEIKQKFSDLKTLSQEVLDLAKSKTISPNKHNKQSIAVSQKQHQVKSPNQCNSFTAYNTPDNLNSLQGSYLNKTQIIQPPKIQSKDMTISEDSQSKTSSKKNVSKEKIIKYGEFALKISQPTSPKRGNLQNCQNMFSQFQQQFQQKELENTRVVTFINLHAQSNEVPGFLNPIEEEQESKLEKNESHHFHNNSKLKFDGNILESGSLKHSANFNQNFTLNNMDSMLKSCKSSQSGIIGPIIEQLDSFAGKINEDSEELRNSSSRRGSEIEPKDMKLSKNIQYRKSKSWRSVNLLQENKFQLTSSEGMSIFPNDNRHETVKSEDRSHIQLNKSIFLEARLKDVENVLLQKQNELIKFESQLLNLKSYIQKITQQNHSLKQFIETNGLKNLPSSNESLKSQMKNQNEQHKRKDSGNKMKIQKIGQSAFVQRKDEGNSQILKGESTLKQTKKEPKEDQIMRQKLEKEKQWLSSKAQKSSIKSQLKRDQSVIKDELEKKPDINVFRKEITSVLNELQRQIKAYNTSSPKSRQKGTKYRDNFTQLIKFIYQFCKATELNSVSKNISQLIDHLIEISTPYVKDQQPSTNTKSNYLNNSNSIQQPQIIFSLASQQKIIKKNQKINSPILQQKHDTSGLSLSKSLSIKNNKNNTSLYDRLDKKPSLSPIKQNHSRQAPSNQSNSDLVSKVQRSFHTPSELYITKNEIQNHLSSFKNDENNLSISIVVKSNRTINLEGEEEAKEFPDDKAGPMILDKNQIVAGVVDDSVQNVLESQKSCQTIEIHVYENRRKISQNVTVEYRTPNVNQAKSNNDHINQSQNKPNGPKLEQKPKIKVQNSKTNEIQTKNVHNQLALSQSECAQQKQPMISISQSLLQVNKEKSPHKLKVGKRWSHGNEHYQSKNYESIYYQENVPVIKISRERTQKNQLSQQKSQKSQQKSQKSQEGSLKSQAKSQISRWPNSMGHFSQDRSHKNDSQDVSAKKRSRKLSFESQVSSLSSEQNNEPQKQETKGIQEEGSVMYTEEQYLQLYKKYKAMQACLLEQTQRNNKKEAAYQSFLKQIKMKIKPYSKLTLEQRLFEAQKRIQQLEKRLKEQQHEYDKEIRKALEQGEKLCQEYLIKLEKSLKFNK